MSDVPDADDTALPCYYCEDQPKIWEDDHGWNCMCPCRWFRGGFNCTTPEEAIKLWNDLNLEGNDVDLRHFDG